MLRSVDQPENFIDPLFMRLGTVYSLIHRDTAHQVEGVDPRVGFYAVAVHDYLHRNKFRAIQRVMLFSILDYVGVALFAVSGAIVASRLRLDIVAFIFFATMTGVGGGTVRDLLLDVPVFWTVSPEYLVVCCVAAVVTWFVAHHAEHLGKPLRWADAIGIAAYSVMGAAKALSVGSSPIVAVIMGVSTATFGGVLRDLVAGEPSAIIKPEIYVTCAFAGASTFAFLAWLGVNSWWAAGAGFCAALFLRGGAIVRGWCMPLYRPK